jgi:transcriptional regulator CtsR
MYTLNTAALETLQYAIDNNITTDSKEEIIETILDQEIVSYCNHRGCVSFDIDDLLMNGEEL